MTLCPNCKVREADGFPIPLVRKSTNAMEFWTFCRECSENFAKGMYLQRLEREGPKDAFDEAVLAAKKREASE